MGPPFVALADSRWVLRMFWVIGDGFLYFSVVASDLHHSPCRQLPARLLVLASVNQGKARQDRTFRQRPIHIKVGLKDSQLELVVCLLRRLCSRHFSPPYVGAMGCGKKFSLIGVLLLRNGLRDRLSFHHDFGLAFTQLRAVLCDDGLRFRAAIIKDFQLLSRTAKIARISEMVHIVNCFAVRCVARLTPYFVHFQAARVSDTLNVEQTEEGNVRRMTPWVASSLVKPELAPIVGNDFEQLPSQTPPHVYPALEIRVIGSKSPCAQIANQVFYCRDEVNGGEFYGDTEQRKRDHDTRLMPLLTCIGVILHLGWECTGRYSNAES